MLLYEKNIDGSNAGGVESASAAVKRPHGSNGQPPSNNPLHKPQQYPHQQPQVKRPHNGNNKNDDANNNFQIFFCFGHIYYNIKD